MRELAVKTPGTDLCRVNIFRKRLSSIGSGAVARAATAGFIIFLYLFFYLSAVRTSVRRLVSKSFLFIKSLFCFCECKLTCAVFAGQGFFFCHRRCDENRSKENERQRQHNLFHMKTFFKCNYTICLATYVFCIAVQMIKKISDRCQVLLQKILSPLFKRCRTEVNYRFFIQF